MKRFVLSICLVVISSSLIFSQDVPQEVKSLVPKLKQWASSQIVITAVKAQNDKNVSLEKIKELDKKWSETSGLDDFMKSVLNNSCADYLKKLRKDNPYIIESFAMDNKGANVGMTNKTSDYWQGDEDKFTKSFNNGVGAVHFGKLAFDESTQSYVIQVSAPVMSGGKAIGAVTFGIDPSKIK